MISVVIPLYNKKTSIFNTLQSVLCQTYTDFEVIVVNDGSTDGSEKIVERISDNRIKLINKANGGVSSARNEGIRQSRSNFVAFLDADDIWEANYLEEQWKMIKDFPNAKMWGTNWGFLYGNTKVQRLTKMPEYFRGYVEDYFKKHLFLYCTCVVTIDKTIFNNIEPFDERINCGEDLDLWYRIILNYPVAYNNKTLVYYKQDAENRITNSTHQLRKHFVYYIDKFEEYRKKDFYFKKYYEHEVLGHLFQFFLKERHNPEIKKILKKIDFSIQPKSYRFRYTFPNIYVRLKKHDSTDIYPTYF